MSAVNANRDEALNRMLKSTLPSITSYEQVKEVNQDNAQGILLQLQHEINSKNDDDSRQYLYPEQVFVKRVHVEDYKHKAWADLRRTLMYARTEVRFYDEILPALVERKGLDRSIAPMHYLARCDLNGLIAEDELTTAVTNGTLSDGINHFESYEKGGFLILQAMGNEEQYWQGSPLTKDNARKCLSAIAKLHATAWEDADLLKLTAERLTDCGGSYHLSVRNPKELDEIEASWNNFLTAFGDCDLEGNKAKEVLNRDSVRKMGARMRDIANYVSKELSPKYNDPFATIVHGDYKAMNVFIPTTEDENECSIIDFASVGVGLGMSDVAMHITHALVPSDLSGGQELELVHAYLEELKSARGSLAVSKRPYPNEEALRHYQLAAVDYCRFVMGRFWKTATPESFEKRKDSPNTVLVNRNLEAALAFIERVDSYLVRFEEEVATTTCR